MAWVLRLGTSPLPRVSALMRLKTQKFPQMSVRTRAQTHTHTHEHTHAHTHTHTHTHTHNSIISIPFLSPGVQMRYGVHGAAHAWLAPPSGVVDQHPSRWLHWRPQEDDWWHVLSHAACVAGVCPQEWSQGKKNRLIWKNGLFFENYPFGSSLSLRLHLFPFPFIIFSTAWPLVPFKIILYVCI